MERSHRGLVRWFAKPVGGNPSGVRIPPSPPLRRKPSGFPLAPFPPQRSLASVLAYVRAKPDPYAPPSAALGNDDGGQTEEPEGDESRDRVPQSPYLCPNKKQNSNGRIRSSPFTSADGGGTFG